MDQDTFDSIIREADHETFNSIIREAEISADADSLRTDPATRFSALVEAILPNLRVTQKPLRVETLPPKPSCRVIIEYRASRTLAERQAAALRDFGLYAGVSDTGNVISAEPALMQAHLRLLRVAHGPQ